MVAHGWRETFYVPAEEGGTPIPVGLLVGGCHEGSSASGGQLIPLERHCGLTLAELEVLYRAPVWKALAYGGNKWGAICAAVCEFAEAAERGDRDRCVELLDLIPKLRHNTGPVEEKLRGLLHQGRR